MKTPLEEPRDLKFYENNAQDDFATTPISVLRYISELEEKVKHIEQIAIGFSKWKITEGWQYAGNDNWTTLIDYILVSKTDSELFKMYLKEIKPTPQ